MLKPNIEIEVTVTVTDPNADGPAVANSRTFRLAVQADDHVYDVARANTRTLGNQALDWLHTQDGTEPGRAFPTRVGVPRVS